MAYSDVINDLIKNYGDDVTQGELIEYLNKNLPPDREIRVQPTGEDEEQTTPRSKIYTEFDYDNDVVITEQTITDGMWVGATGSISHTNFVSESAQSTTSKDYFVQVQDSNSNTDLFDIAFGNLAGNSASIANYKQLRNILLPGDDNKFTFESSDTDSIVALSIERDLLKERIDAGNWQLDVYSASATMSLVDNSAATGSIDKSVSGEKYSIYKGSISGGVTGNIEWGRVYLDQGLVVLDGSRLSSECSIDSADKMYNNIDRFQARNKRNLKDMNYFVRLNNRDYNYSNNPTFFTSSDGSLTWSGFGNDPKVYPTTVGLYNDSNELVSVARLSKPIEKAFDKEVLIKVKISF